jgi:hypothetical protein
MIYNTNHLKKLCHCEMGNEIIKYLFLFRAIAVKSTATLHMSDFLKPSKPVIVPGGDFPIFLSAHLKRKI